MRAIACGILAFNLLELAKNTTNKHMELKGMLVLLAMLFMAISFVYIILGV